MGKTRVLFVVLQLNAGGSERVVLDLARNLDPEEFEVYVAAFRGGDLEKDFRKACKQIFFIDKTKSIDFSAMMKISGIIGRMDIDVVNPHHYMPCLYSFLPATVFHRRKLIYTEHSVPEVVRVSERFHGKILNLMLPRLHSVIGVSKEITESFKAAYPKNASKFHAVLNSVDIEKYSERQHREEVRAEFGLTADHFVVGTVANFRKVKNHACIVRAAARLKDSCPNVRFLLVGTGFAGDSENTEPHIKEMIAGSNLEDLVVCTGYREDVPAVMSAFDAFCLSSFSEGLPVSVLEAMAAGLPVLGSNVSGISEVVEDGHTGLLFPTDDDAELAGLIHGIVRKSFDIETISRNVKNKVVREFNMKSWIETMASCFKNS